jgi:hypothetical protein
VIFEGKTISVPFGIKKVLRVVKKVGRKRSKTRQDGGEEKVRIVATGMKLSVRKSIHFGE